MPRYDSSLNDAAIEDGDVGFVGVNSRLPRWQLPAGMLSLSENGRIDGSWVPRKGVDVVTEGTLSLGLPLRLPFWLVDTSGGLTVSAASRVSELVTLTVAGHGLPVGGDSASVIVNPSGANNSILYTAVDSGEDGGLINISYTGYAGIGATPIIGVNTNDINVIYDTEARMIVSGASPMVSSELFYAGLHGGYPSWTSNGLPFVDNLNVTPMSYIVEAAGQWQLGSIYPMSAPDYVAYADFTASPTTAVWDAPLFGAGTATTTGAPHTASQIISAVNADPVSSALVVASASGTVTGGVADVGPVYLSGGSSNSAYLGLESVTGSPTVDPNGVYLMTPTDANTLEFTIEGATGSETYTVSAPAKVLSRLNDTASSSVLGSCLFSDPASNNAEYIFLAFGNGVSRVKLSDGTVENYGLPGSTTLDGEVDMIQAMDRVFIFREGLVGLQWETGDTDFAEVVDGAVTQPQVFDVTGTFVDVVDGKCTITGLTNNTVSAGDSILIHATTNSNFTEFVGNTYVAFEADGASFSFYIPVKNLSTISTDTLSLGKRVSLGGGYIHQPAFPWAIYFQRRIWGPYWFTDNDSGFTDRDIRDELVASDILDPDIYDPIQNQFRITDGVADYIVALHPYFDDTLLVFNRNSIHAISGTIGSLADCSVKELTREIGCLARRSIVTQGNNVFFLSDNGVYGLDFFNDYNPRGVGKPLSEAIQPYIDRISQSLASGAVGTYFNNRYWLAVPLDSSPREGDAIGNNAILVYNMINERWESVDTFGDPNFLIENFIVGTAESRNDLYAVTANGGIHALDKIDEDYDNIATSVTTGAAKYPIDATMETRAMLCQSLERKRFTRIGVQALSGSSQSDFGMSFNSEDPDSLGSETLASSTMDGPLDPNESADVRVRIGGVRGFNGSVAVRRVFGRPEIRGVKVMATTTNRATLTQR